VKKPPYGTAGDICEPSTRRNDSKLKGRIMLESEMELYPPGEEMDEFTFWIAPKGE